MNLREKIFLLSAVILAVLLFLSNHRGNKHAQRADNLEILRDSVGYYNTKLGKEVATREVLQMSQRDLKKQVYVKDSLLADLQKKFKKIKSAVIVKTETRFDTIQIRYDSIINYEFKRVFTKNDTWYKIGGVSTNKGIILTKVDIPISLRLVSGKKSNWFKTTYTADVSIDNPNIRITDVISQEVTERKKRFVIGIGVTLDITGQPSFGVFAGYSLVRF